MDNPLTSLTIAVLLLVINGFFVAAEFALVKAKGVRIDQLANQGIRSAVLIRKILGNLESYLAACQLGITMASLGLGWVGEPAIAALLEPVFRDWGMSEDTLHTSSFLLGFLLFSSLHIVVGEQVPKTFAIRKPEPMSLWVAYPLQGFYLMAWPLNRLLSLTTSFILSRFGVEEASHGDVMTGEELRDMIGVSGEHGAIETGQAEMLHNLFKFDERTVQEVMVSTQETDMLNIQHTPEENMEMIRRTSHSRFPVVDGDTDNLLGLLLTKDLFNAMLDGKEKPWEHLQDYIRPPLVVPETLLVARLFDTMRSQQDHMAFVVDEYGAFVGQLTLEDLLEEIVGEIADEMDENESEYPITQIADDVWEAHGLLPLSDMEKALGVDVPADLDANTLSGLFMLHLQRIPVVGDTVDCCGFQLKVMSLNGHRVEKVQLEAMSAETPKADAITPPVADI
ncbi:hemolysin family protein [Thiothrix lacustris]|uniref:hemolysin family protein n=1 Tax=Thiothrix lacustris TaxID=525917 RepID=UPI00048F0F5F|nr:hemolysin family protein [Thiothrix lacustris]